MQLFRAKHSFVVVAVTTMIVVAVMLYFVFFRSHRDKPGTSRAGAADTAQMAAVSARMKSVLGALPMTRAFTSAEVVTKLSGAEAHWAGTKPVNARELEASLLESAGEFLTHRFEKSPAEYIAWRERQGYVRRSPEALKNVVGIDGVWRGYFGEATAPALPWDELFTKAIEGQANVGEGRTLAISVANGVQGYEVALGKMTRTGNEPAEFKGLLGDMYRVGGNGSFPSWWSLPRKPKEMLDTTPEIAVAFVGFLAEFRDGVRRVVSLRFVRDPILKRWMIDGCSQGTFDRDNADFARWEY